MELLSANEEFWRAIVLHWPPPTLRDPCNQISLHGLCLQIFAATECWRGRGGRGGCWVDGGWSGGSAMGGLSAAANWVVMQDSREWRDEAGVESRKLIGKHIFSLKEKPLYLILWENKLCRTSGFQALSVTSTDWSLRCVLNDLKRFSISTTRLIPG